MVSDYCMKWIEYAQNDIRIATQEMEAHVNPRHRAYGAILYHCQQGAEKILKAYLLHVCLILFPYDWGLEQSTLGQ